jgi:hypothetical protein
VEHYRVTAMAVDYDSLKPLPILHKRDIGQPSENRDKLMISLQGYTSDLALDLQVGSPMNALALNIQRVQLIYIHFFRSIQISFHPTSNIMRAATTVI